MEVRKSEGKPLRKVTIKNWTREVRYTGRNNGRSITGQWGNRVGDEFGIRKKEGV